MRGALPNLKVKKEVNFEQLPHGINKLLKLSKIGKVAKEKSEIEDLTEALKICPMICQIICKTITFIGAVLISFYELVQVNQRWWNDFIDSARKCVLALPIVSLISFLTGLTKLLLKCLIRKI